MGLFNLLRSWGIEAIDLIENWNNSEGHHGA